ncbi:MULTISPECIES: SDR family oxidoreductase [unclassified Frankia]|uniref:SDR family oxidoreductase n=1 Tax=unclassified Frankia TaxID=2632575 RepID=UPI002023DE45
MGDEGTLLGKVAFVADGTRNLGASLTDALLARGARVAVGYSRRRPEVDEFLEQRSGKPLSAHQGNVASWQDCSRALAEAAAHHGGLDILVTTIGNQQATGIVNAVPLTSLSPQEWQRLLLGSLSGVFNLTSAAAPHLSGRATARIVTVLNALPGGKSSTNPHTWLRDALFTISRQFARELAPAGITVNTIESGLLHDESFDVFPGLQEEAESLVPAGRLGEHEEVARVLLFLLDPASSYVTGQVLGVDGGIRT